MHEGVRTEAGLRENIRVGVQYIEAWLRGRGAVPLYNLMEDAATAEISRAQIWQWLNLGARLDDGRVVTPDLFKAIFADEMAKVRDSVGAGRLSSAAASPRRRSCFPTCRSPRFRGIPDAARLSAARLTGGAPMRRGGRAGRAARVPRGKRP